MPIQPLSRVTSEGGLIFQSLNIMRARPELTVIVAECIGAWAQIEYGLGVALAVILETEAQTALAMFNTLTGSNSQMTMLQAAADAKLVEREKDMVSALLMIVRIAAKDRHKLAHWCWALNDVLPDALLLIEPDEQARVMAHWLGFHDVAQSFDRSRIYVLRKPDAQAMLENIGGAFTILTKAVSVLCESDRGKRAEELQTLSSEPRMAEALRRLRERRKNTPESLV